MLKIKKANALQTYPDGWGTSYSVVDRRISGMRQQVIHFEETTVGERRYWDAYVAGVEIVKTVKVPIESAVDQGDLFVIKGKQYLVRQKSRSDTKMPPSWLLSLESAPIEYSEVSDDG